MVGLFKSIGHKIIYGDCCIIEIESKRNRGMTVNTTMPLETVHK